MTGWLIFMLWILVNVFGLGAVQSMLMDYCESFLIIPDIWRELDENNARMWWKITATVLISIVFAPAILIQCIIFGSVLLGCVISDGLRHLFYKN